MNVISPDKDYPIRFAGSELGADCHICGFFRNPEEEYHLLLPFIKEGIERGEKAFHIVDPAEHQAHLRQLGSAGIDTASAEEKGQLELQDWNQFYFPDGRFDETRTVASGLRCWTAQCKRAIHAHGSSRIWNGPATMPTNCSNTRRISTGHPAFVTR